MGPVHQQRNDERVKRILLRVYFVRNSPQDQELEIGVGFVALQLLNSDWLSLDHWRPAEKQEDYFRKDLRIHRIHRYSQRVL